MAQAIKSPTSARPSALPSKVPEAQKFSPEEQALIDDAASFSAEEQRLIDEAASFQSQQLQPQGDGGILARGQNIISQMEQRIGAAPTPEQASMMRRSMAAEMLGSGGAVAAGAGLGGLVGGGIGGFMAGPMGLVPGAETGAAIGGFTAGSLFSGEAVNFFRDVFNLPEETDRNKWLDIIASVPFLSALKAGKVVGGAITKSPLYISKTLSKLDPQDQQLISALQESVFNSSKDLATEKFASDMRDEVLTDVMDGLSQGLGSRGAISFAAKKYGAKLDSAKKFDEITTKFGVPMTQEEIVRASRDPRFRPSEAPRPDDILNNLNKDYGSEWDKAKALIASNKDAIDKIDIDPIVSSLEAMRDTNIFSPQYRNRMSALIADLKNSKAIDEVVTSKTLTPEEAGRTVIVDAETGKQVTLSELLNKPQRFQAKQVQEGIEAEGRAGKPGVNLPEFAMEEIPTKAKGEPSAQAAFRFYPNIKGVFRAGEKEGFRAFPLLPTESTYYPAEVRKRMVGQAPLFIEPTGPRPGISGKAAEFQSESEQMALQFNQMIGRKKVAALDSLIALRSDLDRNLILSGKIPSDQAAVLDAVTKIRQVEDNALQALSQSPNETIASIGQKAKASKAAVSNHLFQMETIGNITRKDAIGFASFIDSKATDPERVAAFASALFNAPETKNKVVASLIEKKLLEVSRPGVTRLDKQMANAVEDLSKNKDFLAKVEILTGDKSVQKDLSEYSALLKRAAMAAGPNSDRIAGEATMRVADKLTRRVGINPLTWIDLVIPSNSQQAKKLVDYLFVNNKDQFVKSIAQDEASVIDAAVKLNKVLGSRSAPLVQEIASTAMRNGILSAEIAAAFGFAKQSAGGQQE